MAWAESAPVPRAAASQPVVGGAAFICFTIVSSHSAFGVFIWFAGAPPSPGSPTWSPGGAAGIEEEGAAVIVAIALTMVDAVIGTWKPPQIFYGYWYERRESQACASGSCLIRVSRRASYTCRFSWRDLRLLHTYFDWRRHALGTNAALLKRCVSEPG